MSRLISQLALQKDAIKSLEGHVKEMILEKMQLLNDILKEIGIEDHREEAVFLGALLDGIGFGVLVKSYYFP